MIYQNIKRIAKERGLSIRNIERDLKMPNGLLGKYEHSAPSVYRAYEVAKYLGCTVEDLVTENEQPIDNG